MARVTVRNTTPKARGSLIEVIEGEPGKPGKSIKVLELGTDVEFVVEPGKVYYIKEKAR